MKILVLNSGSSSLKYQLFEMPNGTVLCAGLVEKIGEEEGHLVHHYGDEETSLNLPFQDHGVALTKVSDLLIDQQYGVISTADQIDAVGHRVVHGGEDFQATTVVNDAVKAKIRKLFSLAPLHNPANLQGIEVAENVFKTAVQVAVFDTAFHSTLPKEAYRFAIPEKLYKEYGIRAYGFHGTSHRYVTNEAIKYLNLDAGDSKLITIHLGNGCSMAAVKNGQSIDTSMGLGPLSGLVMGTRSGDIDPSVIFYLAESGFLLDEIKTILNKESGMKGMTGDNDLRAIHAMANQGDRAAQLALKVYAYRIKKYVGAYVAAMNGVDAIVFTAGVGENDAVTRTNSLADLDWLGITVDVTLNEKRGGGTREIQSGPVKILVLPTNEELEIANQCFEVLGK